MTSQLNVARGREIVARWCNLAEQRLDYLTELFESGRWRRFYSEAAFLENVREAKAAAEAWRDLLLREGSRDNRAIDMSWLGRARTALPPSAFLRDPLHLPPIAEIQVLAPRENSILPEGDGGVVSESLSEDARQAEVTALVPDLATITDRYPLLRNTL
jgi:uncharacterized repeat protein (TIGR03809 family)